MLHKINKKDLWKTLLEENKHDLINKLRKVEKREEGYGSIVIPKNGFSENLSTHFAVVSWLKDKGINIIDTNKIIDDLEKSLKG